MSPVCVASPGFAPVPETIAGQLRRRLLSLDYPAFARCACKLLDALGYEEARPAGRKEWKGYNRPGGGGYDLEAVLPGGLVPRRVLVQLKHYDAPTIHQRNVDELRGACLRAGGAEALLITTSSFSKVVRTVQASGSQVPEPASSRGISANGQGILANPQIVPVRLIDGQELLGLLIRHRLGVRERGQGGTRRLEIDEAFFRSIASYNNRAQGNNNRAQGNNIMTGNTASFGTISAPVIQAPQENSHQENTHPSRWRLTIRISTDVAQGTRSDDQAEDEQAEDEQPKNELTKGGR